MNLPKPSARWIFPIIIFGQLVAAGTFPIAKIAVTSIEPLTLALLRFSIASIALMTLISLTHRLRKVERRDMLRILIVGLLAVPANQLLFLCGLQYTTAGRSALYFGATPIFVFLLATFFLKEKATILKVLGIVVSFAGVGVILHGGGHAGKGVLFGDFLVILAVVAWAGYTVLGKDLLNKYGSLTITAYALTAGTLAYLPFGLYPAIHFDYAQVPLKAWLSLGYIALMTSVISYSIWYWALARMDTSKLAIFQNLQPVFATVLAVLLVGESLSTSFYLGGVMVIGGVFLTQRG